MYRWNVFDVETGVIDHEAARAWEPYDISHTLLTRWPELRPRLAGKLHVFAGEVDTFYLEGAVERFRARAAAVRLVVLDRTMPGASGSEVLDAIRSTCPEVPILLVSGYCDGAPAEAGRRPSAFLEKPFLPDALLGRVRGMLDGKPIDYPPAPPWSSTTS